MPLVRPYKLPELPYAYDALEPYISEKALRLHHDVHHRKYVEEANNLLMELRMYHPECTWNEFAFNLNGHFLHSLFWMNLNPTIKGSGKPMGALQVQIEKDYESLSNFRAEMTHWAKTTMGSGWVTVSYEPISKELIMTQVHDHQMNHTLSLKPIMVLDVWEHAYYLDYQADKEEYIDRMWNLWNWQDISKRFYDSQHQ